MNEITIEDFMKCIQYKITDGDPYCCLCFGPNARSLDYWNGFHTGDGVSVSMVFDTEDQTVYQMEAWDYSKKREYRWIHPDFRAALEAESMSRGVDFEESYDGYKFIDLETAEDMLEKATAIVNGEEYDSRISVPIDLDDSTMLALMTMAHEYDITFNKLVERILLVKIKELEDAQPAWP